MGLCYSTEPIYEIIPVNDTCILEAPPSACDETCDETLQNDFEIVNVEEITEM